MHRRPNPMSYANRQSTALRASVYDAFAELGGLDSNSKVAQWMFSNPGEAVAEEDEESESSDANGTLRRRHNQHPSRVVSFPDGVAAGPGSSSRPATAPAEPSSSSGATSPTRGLRSLLSIRFLTRRKTRKPLARSRSAAAPRSRDDHDLPSGTPRRAAVGERSKSAVDVRTVQERAPSAMSSRGPSTDDERVPRLVQDKSRESSEDSILATPMSPPRHVRNDTLASWDAVNRYSVTLEDMQKRNPFLHGSRLAEML
ncbi:hypothetical protein EV714DRAFT_271365 [Schizophyllum commune]